MNNTPTEHEEQVRFVAEFRRRYPVVRIIAIPNGGWRNKVTAAKLKAEGVSPGVPDLFIPEWMLWIEMKRQKGGVLSESQKDWIDYLGKIGSVCIVAKGCDDGIRQIDEFLDGKQKNKHKKPLTNNQ